MIALLLFLILAFLVGSSLIRITAEALAFAVALIILFVVLIIRRFIRK